MDQAGDESAPAGASSPNDIAIIGMAGRWPGAHSVAEFWRNAREGRESVSFFSDAELEDSFPRDIREAPDFVRARPILADPDKFDAKFFGMLPREAALADPQHRIFLECAWECIEDAGYDHSRYPGPIGVFAGCSMPTYFLRHVLQDGRTIAEFTTNYQVGMYQHLTGALTDALATRVAYKLNLTGPAATVHTACSTSLFAVAQAWQSLLLYQCDMAVAGGVSITFPQRRGYQHLEGGMVSKDGHCRPFDADASGTLFGDGAGAVLLKRLDDAIADGDRIYAVLKACGVNNDGAAKVGFTAPSVAGQAAAIAAALAIAGVEPSTIGFVETHGTATPLGDPIEFEGLLQAFGAESGRGYCALGSGKANIGHIDAAAGVTGLIRAALALHHGEIPPMLHYRRPNPAIDLANSPFYVPTQATPWPRTHQPRRAGISSFGVGGTNVHAVLEEAPLAAPSAHVLSERPFILPLSARSETALAVQKAALALHIEAHPGLPLADAAYTLQAGRREFEHRTAAIGRNREALIAALLAEPSPVRPGLAGSGARRVIFLFPGQGAQYAGMGRDLYANEALYRELIDQGAELLKPLIGEDIRELLLAPAPTPEMAERINATRIAQPALFLVEYATARLWMSWGITPDAMVGHSIGEFAAAAISGALSFEDALQLVAARGSLMQAQPAGAMLAVRLSEAELRARLGAGLDIAAINAPSMCVASGPFDAIEALEASLAADNIGARRLHTSHAFHSPMMEPAAEALAEEAARTRFAAPQIPWASCVTGAPITAEEAASPAYWGHHCRAPVRFADALARLKGDGPPVVLEVGPGATLTKLAPQILGKDGAAACLASLPDHERTRGDLDVMAESLARCWIAGLQPDWTTYTGRQRRVSLPTYPFERQRHWIEAPAPMGTVTAPAAAATAPQAAAMLVLPSSPFAVQTPAVPAPDSASPISQPGTLMDRKSALVDTVIEILVGLSDEPITRGEVGIGFPELGFDSLFLGQFAQQLQNKFGVKVTFRQLLGDIPTIDALAAHLDAALPADAMRPQPAPAPAPQAHVAAPAAAMAPAPVMPAAVPGLDGNSMIATLLQTQMQLLSVISQHIQAPQVAPAAAAPISAHNGAPAQPVRPATVAAPVAPAAAEADDTAPSRFRMYRPGASGQQQRETTDAQKRFIADLVARYNAKTPKSKAYTARHRPHLADPRAASGFRAEWKDIVYPLVCPRSKGSKLWDLDGNEYIDVVNGFGQTAFGHAPDFVQQALIRQVNEGFAIGPQSELAGEVAETIARMVDAERVTFCNTGSEAVMAAMRVARTVTGRAKVVVFTNDYHGQFDEVLVKAGGRTRGPIGLPVAPGIPNESVANMVVLTYGAPESLDWIRANARDLAAVIVEPVQSRHPELRPVEFVRELRKITEASETALVLDEVVTGFRVHPGGIQALWGIKADMATYGKVLGGGMPVGILAGTSRFMDALDGGQWRYGDDSIPEVAPTFFAGTFVRHPLVLAACKAVLEHLKAEGPALQQRLDARTATLVDELNGDFARRGISTRAEGFSSWFMVNFGAEDRLGSLFYPYARLLGLHTLEGFPCFLTTAHSEADCDRIAEVFREALDAVQSVGILPAKAGAGATVTPLPVAAELPADAPLTEPQREVWMAAQLGDEASCAFNESVTLRLEGKLDLDALNTALADVVARHEVLRARFGATGERMHVARDLTLDLPLIDVSGEDDAELALQAVIGEDARTPFDLANGPVARGVVVRLAPESHALVFTGHHIVCDGWSMNVIMDELSHCYAARLKGARAELLRARSYLRHALEESRKGESRPDVETFWLDLFQTVPPLPELPADRARPERKSFNGATHTDYVGAALYRDAKKTGAKQGCTLFATLFAAFQVLAGRLANHSDIVIAVPTAGQSLLEGEEPLVGHAVNFLPLRIPFDFGAPYTEHLQAVKRHVLAAFDRQDYTFGTLVRKLAIRRDMNRLPLTELQFNLERVGPGLAFEGLTTTLTPNAKAFSNFDIFFNVIESDAGLRIECDYNTDLFDAATIARWCGHFRTLLREFVADASRPIGAMPLLSPDECQWLVEDLNATATPYRRDASLVDLIAEQAARTPDRIAVEAGGARLTFADLEARANRLARYLQRTVTQPQSRIAIAFDRSLDMVVALLAVMKSGHAYVPLDPDHPEARLKLVLETAQVAGLICAGDAMAHIAPASAAVIRLDERSPAIAAEDASPLPSQGGGARPAYIIFTSGSTGTPKGVEVSHGALVNFMQSMARTPGLTAEDTLVSVTTISFDIAALELYLPLMVGGRVVIAGKEDIRGAFGLVDLLNASKVTVLQATPSLWRILLEAKFQPAAGLKMLCGGEPLPRDLADSLIAAGGELWNMYGPTETTIWSSTGRVAPSPAPITIGEPIGNTELHVLDDRDQLAPVGVAGHLYIGGDGLANGYFTRPDLTAAAFRDIALGGRPPRRLYRTGDLARRTPDGTIQMLGRIDQQIKLRGFRIELEDIESALRKVPGVAAAAVALRPGPSGDPRLVGYYVAIPGATPAAADLATLVSGELPDYMVPTAWKALDALPVTPNGKLDRKALPDVSVESAAVARLVTPPTTDMEVALAAIWRDVLGLNEVGIHDSLFSLGADSLQLFRIAARMADKSIPLQARHLLQHPTIAELAKAAEEQSKAPKPNSVPSLRDFRHGARRGRQIA